MVGTNVLSFYPRHCRDDARAFYHVEALLGGCEGTVNPPLKGT